MGPRLGVLALALAGLPSSIVHAGSPPASEPAPEPQTAELRGRVLAGGGRREPVPAAVVMVVAAPDDVRPGRPARDPLDPETLTWVLRAETDAEGRFSLAEVPVGKVRIVVIAGGYARFERWAQAGGGARARELELYLSADETQQYRTEVQSERRTFAEPTQQIDGQQIRHHAGGADDPVLALLNVPGAARSPGGLGLLALRGGNPTETGYYLDGHPIPRAFHVIPIAGVVSPPMVHRVDLSPGNYEAAYGSFGGGLVHIHSRPGERRGVHGQAHLDLFDAGTSIEAPLGPGSIHFGGRRSHVDAVLRGVERVTGPTNLLAPSYWDYLGRVDLPLAPGHRISLRALGAGDRLRGPPAEIPGLPPFDYASSFHRFDFEYVVEDADWRVLVSPSLRLDDSRLEQAFELRRSAWTFSGRVQAETDLGRRLTLQLGSDMVATSWRRRDRTDITYYAEPTASDVEIVGSEYDEEVFEGRRARFGAWVAAALRLGSWTLTPSLRANAFNEIGQTLFRFDPRLDLRVRLSPVAESVELYARVGMYGVPVVTSQRDQRAGLINRSGPLFGGIADVPPYLVAFFDPSIDAETDESSLAATSTVHASTGVLAALPWQLDLRATLFWRERLPGETVFIVSDDVAFPQPIPRARSMGLELLLRRSIARGLDGWIGYTLLWARRRVEGEPWFPATFDQRHSLVILLSAALPRNFRVGMRFRLVSGNPLQPVLGSEIHNTYKVGWGFEPIRGKFGTAYQPLFHQLDLRVDKRWPLRRVTVGAYLDVQNVYDNRYPEIYVYTADWGQRSSLLGLPIYPSLGVTVDF